MKQIVLILMLATMASGMAAPLSATEGSAFAAPVGRSQPKAWHLQEGFEGSWLPTSWDTVRINGTYANFLTRVISGTTPTCTPHDGTYMVKYASYVASAGNRERLITAPVQITSNCDSFSFWMTHDAGYPAKNDRIIIEIMTKPAYGIWGFWTAVDSFSRYQASFAWGRHAVPLGVYNGDSVRIAVTGHSAYGNNIYLDDAAVGYAYIPVSHDISVQSVDTPATIMPPTAVFQPAMTIGNPGQGRESDFKAYFQINDSAGAQIYIDSVVVASPDSMDTASTRQLVFSGFVPAEYTRYQAVAWVTLAGDGHPENDLLSKKFRTFDRDIVVTAIISPIAGTVVVADTIIPRIAFHNNATESTIFEGHCRIDSAGIALYEQLVTVVNLAPGGDTTVQFPVFIPHASGNYILSASCYLEHDLHAINDTLSRTFSATAWRRELVSQLPAVHECHATVYASDFDQIYVIGGTPDGGDTYDATVHQYDPLNDIWTDVASLPAARYWLAAAYCHENIYAIGGYTDDYSSQVDVYNIIGNNWTSGPALQSGIVVPAAVAWRDSLVYRIGGNSLGSYLTTVQYLDAYETSPVWIDATDLPLAWGRGGYTIMGDTIYLVGGFSTGSFYMGKIVRGVINPADPAIIAWDTTITLPYPNAINGCDALDGKIYMIGGFPGVSQAVGTVMEYDVHAAVWSQLPSLPTPNTRWDNAVTRHPPGKEGGDYLYVVGGDSTGYGSGYWYASATVYRYSKVVWNGISENPATFVSRPRLVLLPNRPNPVISHTTLCYELPAASSVNLSIYAITGQLVRTVVNGRQQAGSHSIAWNGTDNSGRRVSSGIYVCKLSSAGSFATRKLVMVR